MTPYKLRPYTEDDEDFAVYSWLKSYAHSRYGIERGANVDASPEELAYWAEHRPIVMHLLATCHTVCAVDASDPSVMWGWACTSGDTVHYVVVKRKFHQAGLSGDIYRDLLGTRLSKACAMTHELVDFKRAELRAAGIMLPKAWYFDTTYFGRKAA